MLLLARDDDGLIKIAMKGRKTPNDFFTGYDSAQEKMDAVLAEVAKETTEQAVQLDSEAQTTTARGMGLAADIEVDPINAELQARGWRAYRLKAARAVRAYAKLASIQGLSEKQVRDALLDSMPGQGCSNNAAQ